MTKLRRARRPTIADGELWIALIYLRVSSDEQEREGLSLPAQLADDRRYVQQRGWIIGGEFKDVLTGKRDDRPDYQNLLEKARELRAEGQNVVVVVKWLHRFGRHVSERVRCWEELDDLGVPIHSVAEGGAVLKVVHDVLAALAEEEVRQIGERVSDVLRHMRSQGWRNVTPAPWGYRWRSATQEERAKGSPKSVLDLDPVAAPFVRQAFEREASGEAARSVSRWVAGLPSGVRQGRSMRWQSVLRMLHSPLYISRDFSSRARWSTPDVLGAPKGNWPAMIDDLTWVRVQEQIAAHHNHPRQASQRYLLSGYLRCPFCGQRMNGACGRTYGREERRYRCGGFNKGGIDCTFTTSVEAVDRLVVAAVDELLIALSTDDPAWRAALRRAWQAMQRPADVSGDVAVRNHLEAQVGVLRQRIIMATENFCDGIIPRTEYDVVCAKARQEIEGAQAELDKRLQHHPVVKSLPPLDAVLREVNQWHIARFSEDVVRAQREVLSVLVDHVVPRRVRYGSYDAQVVWTDIGQVLRDVLADAKRQAA